MVFGWIYSPHDQVSILKDIGYSFPFYIGVFIFFSANIGEERRNDGRKDFIYEVALG